MNEWSVEEVEMDQSLAAAWAKSRNVESVKYLIKQSAGSYAHTLDQRLVIFIVRHVGVVGVIWFDVWPRPARRIESIWPELRTGGR